MKPKTRTILRHKPKGLRGRGKTGQKVSGLRSQRTPDVPPGAPGLRSDRSVSAIVAVLPDKKSASTELRMTVPKGLKEDLEDMVNWLGLWSNLSDLGRSVLLKERDKRIGELRRAKKAAEREAKP